MDITREQAVCIFFCEKYTQSNVAKLLKRLDNIEDVDICFDENPLKPFLLPNSRINTEPLKYKRYDTLKSTSETTCAEKKY